MRFEEFLKEVAPMLGLSWRPFRRKGIRRRIERRILELGFSGFEEYGSEVSKNSEEQRHLSRILTVTISRFFRDKEVFDRIRTSLLPSALREKEGKTFRVWSIGCASGEEPYSLSVLWKAYFEKKCSLVTLSLIATDIDERLLERAMKGRYKKSSLTEVPNDILEEFFEREHECYVIDERVRESVQFLQHDVLRDEPISDMDMVLCRNVAFTYFSKPCMINTLEKIALCLNPRGHLVIGKDEGLPLTYPVVFTPVFREVGIHRKLTQMSTGCSGS